MKLFYKTTTAAGMALALLAGPLALAQTSPGHGDDLHGGTASHPMAVQHAPEHGPAPAPRPMATPHPAEPGHMAMQPAHPMMPSHANNQTIHVTHVTNENVHVTQSARPAHGYVYHGHPMRQAAFSGHYWHHGDHYDGQRYVVSNWQYYDLQAPPDGYEWVQDGSQFVLIAVASGIIADIILGAEGQ